MGNSNSKKEPKEVKTYPIQLKPTIIKMGKENISDEDNLVVNLLPKSGFKPSAKEPLKYKNLLSIENHFDIKNKHMKPENSTFQIDLNLLFQEISEICVKMNYIDKSKNIISNFEKMPNTKRIKNAILVISELKNLLEERIYIKGILEKNLQPNEKPKKAQKSKLRAKEEIKKSGITKKEYTEIRETLMNIEQKIESVMDKGLSLQQALIDSPDDPIILISNPLEKHQEAIKEQILVLEKVLNEYFVCPIGLSILTDPVIADDGQTYERQNILEWFNKSNYSPITHKSMTSKYLKPNFFASTQIEDLKTKIKILKNKLNQ